jgi:hypothetical protein
VRLSQGTVAVEGQEQQNTSAADIARNSRLSLLVFERLASFFLFGEAAQSMCTMAPAARIFGDPALEV